MVGLGTLAEDLGNLLDALGDLRNPLGLDTDTLLEGYIPAEVGCNHMQGCKLVAEVGS